MTEGVLLTEKTRARVEKLLDDLKASGDPDGVAYLLDEKGRRCFRCWRSADGALHAEEIAFTSKENARGDLKEEIETDLAAPWKNKIERCDRVVNVSRLVDAAPGILSALVKAIPYLSDHVAMTRDEGPGDRVALDMCIIAAQMLRECGVEEANDDDG